MDKKKIILTIAVGVVLVVGIFFLSQRYLVSNSDLACYENISYTLTDKVVGQCTNGSWSDWVVDEVDDTKDTRTYTGQMGVYEYSLNKIERGRNIGNQNAHACVEAGGYNNFRKGDHDYRGVNVNKVVDKGSREADLHTTIKSGTKIKITNFACGITQTREGQRNGDGGMLDDGSESGSVDDVVTNVADRGDALGESQTITQNGASAAIASAMGEVECSMDKIHWKNCETDVFRIAVHTDPIYVRSGTENVNCFVNQTWSIFGENINPITNIKTDNDNVPFMSFVKPVDGVFTKQVDAATNTCNGSGVVSKNIRVKILNMTIEEK